MPELTVCRIHTHSPDAPSVRRLYEAAFPANERRSFQTLLTGFGGQAELYAFHAGDAFAGFVSLLSAGDVTHILYLAIAPELRGQGYGSQALRLVRGLKPEARIIADLETPYEGALNNGQRTRRIAFYERNGFAKTAVRYTWNGERYEILVSGGAFSEADFNAFWRRFGIR